MAPLRQRHVVIAELAVSLFVDVAEGFAVANEKKTHQPSRIVGYESPLS
jgi:hypothetical protein